MPETPPLVRIRLSLPEGAYMALALPAVVSATWLIQGHPVWAAGALAVLLLLLPVGQKFELDCTRRYRDGWHWAHWLNPAWQPLPAVQGVLVRPYAYRPQHPAATVIASVPDRCGRATRCCFRCPIRGGAWW